MTSEMTPHATSDAAATRLLAAHAAPRSRTVDDHMFCGSEQHPAPGTFRLQLFTAADVRPVALVVQTLESGPSLVNRAEEYALSVWRCHRPDDVEPPLWVQRQLDDLDDDTSPFQLVTFEVTSDHELAAPRWHRLTDAQVEQLLGQRADGGRGDGYRPPAAEPEEIPVYEITPLAALPQPRPFRQPSCMPGTRSWRRLLFWRTHPARPALCCWYHQQDWTRLADTATALFEAAQNDGVTGPDIASYVLDKAQAAGLSGGDVDALHTLFSPALGICATSGFTNGQHRVQAMRDQGVSRTVTVRWHTPEPPPSESEPC
ncbi:hypothetical protein [Streptomyces brasiliscabiei]|uniref:hypothetical protein n=1 Tax=Streptomyces brasiliscabiei TaxID=2736302 RepID=UPI001C0F8FFC|nr:hypothetical protein [Streptomyces brasiliscabiei]